MWKRNQAKQRLRQRKLINSTLQKKKKQQASKETVTQLNTSGHEFPFI